MDSQGSRRSRVWRVIPFLLGTLASLWVSAGQLRRRKPFYIDLNLSAGNVLSSLTKVPHYASSAGMFLLAVLAVGAERIGLAFAMTMALGAAWELVEAGAAGHSGRVADLAPDFVGALVGLVLVYVVRAGLRRRRRGGVGS